VLSVRSVAIKTAAPSGARSVQASSKIETVIPMLLERDEPIAVVNDDGSHLGIVDRSSIAAILSAEQR
jgi:CBS-domain-containing membrane protein